MSWNARALRCHVRAGSLVSPQIRKRKAQILFFMVIKQSLLTTVNAVCTNEAHVEKQQNVKLLSMHADVHDHQGLFFVGARY